MDEPCSALDPISTLAIEDLIEELKQDYTIVIVTHNMQQASRVSDKTAFFNIAGTGKPGQAHRVRRDLDDVLEPVRQGDRGLRLGQVRLIARRDLGPRSKSAGRCQLVSTVRIGSPVGSDEPLGRLDRDADRCHPACIDPARTIDRCRR